MWTKLSRRQQEATRRARAAMGQDGWGVTVSQLAKQIDLTMDYLRGDATADALAAVTNGERLARKVSVREAAAELGVSVRTVQRRAAAGKIAAHKDERGRWVVTL